jgi:hypothetical protein
MMVAVQLPRPLSQSLVCWWKQQQQQQLHKWNSSSCCCSILYRDNCGQPRQQQQQRKHTSCAHHRVGPRPDNTTTQQPTLYDGTPATAAAAAHCRRYGHRRAFFSTTTAKNTSLELWNQTISRRDWADLEDTVCTAVARTVVDPVLHVPLDQLQWLMRRIGTTATTTNASIDHDSNTNTTTTSSLSNKKAVESEITLQMLLRPPSLLHPSLDELKELVRVQATAEICAWLELKEEYYYYEPPQFRIHVDVQAVPSNRPVPMMARLVHDQEELLASLGPGLQSVAHCIAVYSCKVRTTTTTTTTVPPPNVVAV